MASEIDREGIGGWLALLIFWLIVLRPLAGISLWWQMHGIVQSEQAIGDSASPLVNTSVFWFLVLTSAALSIYAGIRLLRERSPATVRAAIAIIWTTVPLSVLAGVVARAFFEGRVDIPLAATSLALQIAIAAVSTGYLLRSRRVKNTYFDRSA
jgi:hypothetical protein